jgi:hypothetical protein
VEVELEHLPDQTVLATAQDKQEISTEPVMVVNHFRQFIVACLVQFGQISLAPSAEAEAEHTVIIKRDMLAKPPAVKVAEHLQE